MRAVLRHIHRDGPNVRVLGPQEFAPYLENLRPLSPSRQPPDLLALDYVILRQDGLSTLSPEFVAALSEACLCAVSNRFAVFTPKARARNHRPSEVVAVDRRVDQLARGGVPHTIQRPVVSSRARAIVVTTFNRPAALARSLPQIAALGCPTVVVNDGSEGAAAAWGLWRMRRLVRC